MRAALFPVASVERDYRHGLDTAGIDAARIDADAVRVRARNVERFHAASRAEQVFCDARVEGVGRERISAAEQFEAIFRHYQMQKSDFAANRAVAFVHFDGCRCNYFEADQT